MMIIAKSKDANQGLKSAKQTYTLHTMRAAEIIWVYPLD